MFYPIDSIGGLSCVMWCRTVGVLGAMQEGDSHSHQLHDLRAKATQVPSPALHSPEGRIRHN